MKNLTRWTLAGALAALVVMPGRAEAQISWTNLYDGTYCGGTEFEFCADVTLSLHHDATTGGIWYELAVTNLTSPEILGDTFTRMGLVNLPIGRREAVTNFISGGSVLYNGDPDANWAWDANQGLNGPFPKPTTAFVAVPGIGAGMDDGYSVTFRFNVVGTDWDMDDLTAVGWAIHSQGIGECSSKMGAWAGGDVNTPGDELNQECYPVPEPGTNALLAIGMVGLAFVAVRRRSLSELLG